MLSTILYLTLITLVFANITLAKTIYIEPTRELQSALDATEPGDQVILMPGQYQGNIKINHTLTLTSSKPRQAVIIGDRKGSAIVVNADDVELKELVVEGSGLDLSTQDSGIFVNKDTKNVKIHRNLIRDNLIGVYLWGSIDSDVFENHIIGQDFRHVNDRGNGVQIWSSPGSVVRGNRIQFGRDGIFTTTSKNNLFINNYFSELRYSIHYMYTTHSRVEGNYSINNDIAYALMFSDYLEVYNNISVGSKEYGIFNNFINYTDIQNNIVIGTSEKCLMLYNSNFNTIGQNHFERCLIGLHYTAGSQDNIVFSNNFVKNYNQVKFVGTTEYEFSKDKEGNHWSDYSGYDLNRDGIGDQVYHPNSVTDQILWRNRNTKVLFNSPVIQLLNWSQSYFPALMPGGIKDSYPSIMAYPYLEHIDLLKKPPFDYERNVENDSLQ